MFIEARSDSEIQVPILFDKAISSDSSKTEKELELELPSRDLFLLISVVEVGSDVPRLDCSLGLVPF